MASNGPSHFKGCHSCTLFLPATSCIDSKVVNTVDIAEMPLYLSNLVCAKKSSHGLNISISYGE